MRAEDLDNNGEADCVGLHVQDIRIITDPRISVDSLGYSPGISGKVLKTIRYEFLDCRVFWKNFYHLHHNPVYFENLTSHAHAYVYIFPKIYKEFKNSENYQKF